jgi:hypothetical protein
LPAQGDQIHLALPLHFAKKGSQWVPDSNVPSY